MRKFWNVLRAGIIFAAMMLMVSVSTESKATFWDDYCPNYAYGIYYATGEATTKELQGYSTSYNKMPQAVRDYFTQAGMKIYMFKDGEPGMLAFAYSPSFKYDYRTYKMQGISTPGMINIFSGKTTSQYDSLIHEFGHQVDYYAVTLQEYYNYEKYGISSTAEWANFYNAYAAALKKVDSTARNNMYSEAEAWAECFRLLYTKPEKLSAISQDLYNYVVAQVVRLIGPGAAPGSVGTVGQGDAVESKAGFDYMNYADTYPDLKAAFGYNKDMLWNHYQQFGKAEGRIAKFNPVTNTTGTYSNFDYKFYADANPDVKAAFGYNKKNLWNHYQKYGKREGRVVNFL